MQVCASPNTRIYITFQPTKGTRKYNRITNDLCLYHSVASRSYCRHFIGARKMRPKHYIGGGTRYLPAQFTAAKSSGVNVGV